MGAAGVAAAASVAAHAAAIAMLRNQGFAEMEAMMAEDAAASELQAGGARALRHPN